MGLVPDQVIYNNIREAFFKMGNMDQALRIVDRMRREPLQTSSRTFRPIIEGFALAGDIRRGT
jgi:pentatricopeptide repeat protein